MSAYPRHLVRFPAALIPASSSGRRRAVSIGRFVWLGSHPLLLLTGIMVNLCTVAFLLAWIAAVTVGWALWTLGVSVWWLAALPFRNSRGE